MGTGQFLSSPKKSQDVKHSNGVWFRKEHLAKIDKRIQNYEVKKLNDPRPGKKLLVLDVDYTLFDHRSNAEKAVELMRPYLHEFLAVAYVDYDIVIWCKFNLTTLELPGMYLEVL